MEETNMIQGQQNGCPSSHNRLEQTIKNLLAKVKSLDDGIPQSDKELIVKVVEYLQDIAKQDGIFIKSNDFGCYIYTGYCWEKIDDIRITILLRETMLKCGVGKVRCKHFKLQEDIIKQFKANFISVSLENPIHLINLKNGTFNLNTNELQQHCYKDSLDYVLDYDYDPKADCPMFKSFLNKVLPKEDFQTIIQEFAGWIFSDLKLEKALMLYGTGANGKSVLMEVLSENIGRNLITSFDLESLADVNSLSIYPYSRAKLNLCTDISPKMKNSAMFKRLVSNEPMEARQLYKGYISVYPNTKLIFSMNSLLETDDMSDGFFRRCLIIPFEQTIPEWERDKLLAQKIITTELSGVFNWILEGRKRIEMNQSFTESCFIEDTLDKYRLKADSVASFLEITGYIKSTRQLIRFTELYKKYIAYCNENGYTVKSNKHFGKRLDELGYQRELRTGNKLFIYAEDETEPKLP